MPAVQAPLPQRRTDLIIRPLGERGRFVVKDPGTGSYFHLGEQEHFLLLQLCGEHAAAEVCRAFEERFAEPLSPGDLEGFLALARGKGLLQSTERGAGSPEQETAPAVSAASAPRPPVAPARLRQSILYWRTSLFDPDRFCTWLEPKIRWVWTRAFLAVSAACIVLALVVVATNGQQIVTNFARAFRWETLLLAWLALLLVTTLHELAHGLTCKHYGGEVHEIGFLLMYFLPCFYCNVSDAWLFREKSKRLLVTFAGGYFELFLWALAVFVWRLTALDSLINYLAWVVLSIVGARIFFNLNPLIKLDGYYLLSDWLEIPNLRQRSWEYVAAHLRWLLWGAARPARQERGRMLIGYGLASWLYSLAFLSLMLWGFFQFLWSSWGWAGLACVGWLSWVSAGGLFRGISSGEVRNMFLLRHKRLFGWLLLLVAAPPTMQVITVEDRVTGPFQVRSASRAELRAEVAGFLREVHFTEGDRVSPGAIVARLEVPDLASRIAQKQAEIREAEAKLRLLEIGPRPEEVAEQKSRVARMEKWRDLAREDLARARQAYQEELSRLDRQIVQHTAELTAARDGFERAKELRRKGAIPQEQIEEALRKYDVAQAVLDQSHFQKRHRQALGTREAIAGLDADSELARREKDLADSKSALTLLEIGARPEEKEAQRAALDRLREELRYWEAQQVRLLVKSPVDGLVTTPRLKEKINHYLHEGDLICEVEEPSLLAVEVALTEQEAERVRVGQPIELHARALPLKSVRIEVERIAPLAVRGAAAAPPVPGDWETSGTVIIYGRLPNADTELRSGMTGHARIYTGRRPLGTIALGRTLSWLRTEFWW
ncbi:MAG TPA: HlyD family efflux transporter periplasmic adaptor subunit [Pirellulaceae bacterium]|nr:HlyD family efflux transporter periplasmic adaptor subunit [Pirellulaceae bacterium]